jgi:hypothetical protein
MNARNTVVPTGGWKRYAVASSALFAWPANERGC